MIQHRDSCQKKELNRGLSIKVHGLVVNIENTGGYSRLLCRNHEGGYLVSQKQGIEASSTMPSV